MHISRIKLDNFRNLDGVDVSLRQHTILVGENGVGKSNLLFALRLILDPSLPDSERYLELDDFSDTIDSPLSKGTAITVCIEISNIIDADALTVLTSHLIQITPPIARITYQFSPKEGIGHAVQSLDNYDFTVYGGTDPSNLVSSEVRRRLPMINLAALRNTDDDLRNWRRSPLRPLLDKVAATTSKDVLASIANDIGKSSQNIMSLPDVQDLAKNINEALAYFIGAEGLSSLAFGVSPVSPDRILRTLQLLIDQGKRGISAGSLGNSNVVYLALKFLEIQQLCEDNVYDHVTLSIEEPEAHLHPQLQRMIFQRIFSMDWHSGAMPVSLFLSTHSPNITSVAPLQSLLTLRKSRASKKVVARSLSKSPFGADEISDLQRFLDVTRAECLFARGIILVEGIAEEYIVPTLAALNEINLDEVGVSIFVVDGTHFGGFDKMFGPDGLDIPFAILTDADPDVSVGKNGFTRVRKILAARGLVVPADDQNLKVFAAQHGIFLGEYTLELDLALAGQHEAIFTTMHEQADSEAARQRVNKIRSENAINDTKSFIKDINAIGKGRFAQRVAPRLTGTACPTYIRSSLSWIIQQITNKS